MESGTGDSFFAAAAAFEASFPFGRPLCSLVEELLFLLKAPLSLLRLLECIPLRHACSANDVTESRGVLFVLYKDFSAGAVQDASADEVADVVVLVSRKSMLHDAKLFDTDLLAGNDCCVRGLLQENLRCELKGVREREEFRVAEDCCTGPRKRDHSLWVMFEDMSSQSSRIWAAW